MAVVRARGGLTKDIDFLRTMLQTHELLLTLAKAMPRSATAPNGGQFVSDGQEPIAVHAVSGPREQIFCPLFSEVEIFARSAAHFGWTTDGGPPQLLKARGTAALEFALGLAEAGSVQGAVLNPFHESAWALNVDEIRMLLSDQPRATANRKVRGDREKTKDS